MFTLGFVCLFLAIILAIMFMMALATRGGRGGGDDEN